MLVATKDKKITGPEDLKAFQDWRPRASTPDAAVTALAPPGTRIHALRRRRHHRAGVAVRPDRRHRPGHDHAQGVHRNEPLGQLRGQVRAGATSPMASRCAAVRPICSKWVNTFIYFVKNNGELDAICRKWMGAPLPELPVF